MARVVPDVVMRGPATATWEALGTTALVRVAAPEALAGAATMLDRQLRELDLAASRFRADSEISALNRAGGRVVAVSPLLAELIAQALRAADCSDGIVNPAVGWALVRAGYDRDFAAVLAGDEPELGQIAAGRGVGDGAGSAGGYGSTGGSRSAAGGLAAVLGPIRAHRQDWRAIELDRDAGTVRLPAGMRIDLGATAKAYAADRAANEIAASSGVGVLVALGGDIATAGAALAGGWQISVGDDHRDRDPEALRQQVSIASGALATSSTTVRRWRHGGEAQHHIIDPRVGRPAAGPWRTVSATARTCVDANIATTAALVLGERAVAWLTEAEIAARLVAGDGTLAYTCGWPDEALTETDA